MTQFASTLYPQTNPTNPILTELREDWEGDIRGAGIWFRLACADLVAGGVDVTREHKSHALRVLDRLASFSG